MRNTLISTLVATGLALGSTVVLGDEAAKPLLSQELSGMEETQANVIYYDVDPGFATERHLHPGHVFIYVIEGEIELDVEGEEPVRPSAGYAGYEPPDKPMVGRNASSTERARFVVFEVGRSDEPLTVAQ
jgi:quercetin dioxygenase-like cupin family protein